MSLSAALQQVPSTLSTLMEHFDLPTNFVSKQAANGDWVYTHTGSDAAHPTTVTFSSQTFTRDGQIFDRVKITTVMWVKVTDTLVSAYTWQRYYSFQQVEIPLSDTTAMADVDKFLACAGSAFYVTASAGVRDTVRQGKLFQAHNAQV
jgi:hypothetical protein